MPELLVEESEDLPTPARAARVLVCAATKWEVEPLARRLGLRPKNGRWESVSGRPVVLLKTGVGPVRAAAAMPKDKSFDLIVSAGFAGSLQPDVKSGDLVLDVREGPAEWPPIARTLAAEQKKRIHFGRILHSDSVVGEPAAKRKLGAENRACAVDMETQAIKQWAAQSGASVLAARVVLDGVDDRLPEVLPDADDDYGDNIGGAIKFTLSHPGMIPSLIKLGLTQKRAIATLGNFLAELLEIL